MKGGNGSVILLILLILLLIGGGTAIGLYFLFKCKEVTKECSKDDDCCKTLKCKDKKCIEPKEPKPKEPKPDEPKPKEPKPDEPKPDEPKPDEPKPECKEKCTNIKDNFCKSESIIQINKEPQFDSGDLKCCPGSTLYKPSCSNGGGGDKWSSRQWGGGAGYNGKAGGNFITSCGKHEHWYCR